MERSALDVWSGGHRPVETLSDITDSTSTALLCVSGRGAAPGDSLLGPTGIRLDSLAAQALPALVVLNGCGAAQRPAGTARIP